MDVAGGTEVFLPEDNACVISSRLKTQNHLFDLHKVQGYKVKETPIKVK